MEKCFAILPYCDELENDRYSEIKALLKTAGAILVAYEPCKIIKVTPSTYIGKGKLQEIKNCCDELQIETVVFDGELTPSQTLNISDALDGRKVIDRTTLILDIFALSAKSAEGKIQVELAQLKHIYPRLKGKGEGLSRLGGGIGSRGPGESKLETDRRHIRQKINFLEKKLIDITAHRNLQYEHRKKKNVISVALVGYTNTGKSTLLNSLTGSNVLAENKLFATLDPTLRSLSLGSFDIILADTVGFIKNVPTTLIEAFKSTLQIAVNSDFNLIVCDATSNDWESQLKTTVNMLDELNAKAPRLVVFNKSEGITDFSAYPKDAVFISALYKKGFEGLLCRIKEEFSARFLKLELKIPFELSNIFIALANAYAESYDLTYTEDGVIAYFLVKKQYIYKFGAFIK